MSITISIYVVAAIVILSLMGGFWIGRSVKWMMIDTENRIVDEERHIPSGWAVGSPVTGTVRSYSEGGGRGVLIRPEQEKIYAPVAGKIIRLYPMGNAMRLRTDSGIELMLRVGETGDEMHSGYYRSYVVQNEIVSKGKLLLEFDREGLQQEGIDVAVSVTVEAADAGRDIIVTEKEKVKFGEEIFYIEPVGEYWV